MKILVLAESLRVNETSSGIVSSTFINALLLGNHTVDCIYQDSLTYPITWLNGVDNFVKVSYVDYQENKVVKKIPKLRGALTNLTGLHIGFKKNIYCWVNKIEKQLEKKEYDLIIALGSGCSFLPHYALVRIKTAAKKMMNFHDPYPMTWYPEPYKHKWTIFYKWQEWHTKQICKEADFISFPSELLKQHMIEKTNVNPNKCFVLPHVGCDLFNLPGNKNDSSVFLAKDKFNILHSGALLGPRGIDALFEAYELFLNKDKKRKEKTVLNILGNIDPKHQKNIGKGSSDNYQIINKRVSYKKSKELQKEADVALVIEAISNFSPFMPGKLSDIFFLEKVIFALTPVNSETRRLLGENYEYLAKADEVAQILKCFEALWDNWRNENLVMTQKSILKKYVSAKQFNEILKQNLIL